MSDNNLIDRKAFVLLSGGLDSTTCLYQAVIDFAPAHVREDMEPGATIGGVDDMAVPCDWVEGVSINYGQRHSKELVAARKICDRIQAKHTIIDLHNILAGSMLTDASKQIPDKKYDELVGVSPTYVPFRNGLLLALITAHAQKWINQRDESVGEPPRQAGIYFGAHAEDAHNWAYPDCTPEFIGAMANAIYIGSYMAIRLTAPLQTLMKDQIVAMGEGLGVPFEDTWSCYAGGAVHCGKCPTCYARQEAFRKAGVSDPTIYAKPPR